MRCSSWLKMIHKQRVAPICAILPAMFAAPDSTSFLQRWFWHLCCSLLLPLAGMAQPDWQLLTSANAIASHEQITISYTLVNAAGTGVKFPAFKDWDVLSGPMTTTSTNIINGVKSTAQQYSFQLAPRRTGSCSVPAASIVVNGKSYQTNTLVIEVTKGAQHNNSPYPPNEHGFTYDAFVLDSKENAQEKIKRNLLLKTKLSKNTCYEGETIVAEYLLYSRVNLSAELDKRPGFEGFSSIDLPAEDPGSEFQYATENGKVYKVYTLRRVQLTALRSGELKLAPMSISGTVSFLRTHNGQPIAADPYAQQRSAEEPFTVAGNVETVQVTPLPANGRPTDGAIPVGEFSYSVQMPKQPLAAGDAAELIVAVSGLGQWSMLQAPQIEWPKGITGYEPRMDEQLDSQRVPVQGVRRYIYRFAADSMGEYNIRIKGFHYFNPSEVVYKQTADSSVNLHIGAAVARSSFADDPVNDPSSFKLTEWFTRFMPVVALSAALVLVIVLMLVGRAKRKKRNTTQELDPIFTQGLDDPMYQVTTAAGNRPLVVEKRVDVKDTSLQQDATDIKALATRMLAEVQQENTGENAAAQQLLQLCNDVLYAPFGHQHSVADLRQAYAEWKETKA